MLAYNYSTSVTRGLFAEQVLLELGAPITDKNMIALVAWMAGEGTKAQNNPLATTRSFGVAENFNSSGVKNYPTLQLGIRATVATLRSGLYGPILAALAKGDNIQHVVWAIVASPWGTQSIPWEAVNGDPAAYAALRVTT